MIPTRPLVSLVPDAEEPLTLVMDVHEPVEVLDGLQRRGVPVERRKLHPADYVVGAVGVERKNVRDFFSSLTSKRLFEQVTRLKESYSCPILILEGDAGEFVDGLANPDAFWGALASVAVDAGVPVLPTPTRDGTAAVLARVHARLSREGARSEVRFKPRLIGPAAELKFVVQGLPGVGDVQSARLLERFGTVRRVFQAAEKDLVRVPGLGKKKAHAIADVLDRDYEGAQRRLPDGEEE